MGPEALAHVLRPLAELFQADQYPDLLVGLGSPDDAAVYRLNADQAIISTVDFFPPVVDDPFAFGAIAAANALSDVYAMGGTPLFALNLAAFPDDLPHDLIAEILHGGGDKVREAGAVIAGGHTVTDREPKYGLAVTGLVHPDRIITKGGALPGDHLVLTKALGTGVITTAHKRGEVDATDLDAAIASMLRLNRHAAQAAMQTEGVRAMTDITGFGLLGHAHEMAHLSSVNLRIEYSALPWLTGARRYAEAWVFPGGAERNEDFYGPWVGYSVDTQLADWERRLLHDPQTSGGLLIAVTESQAAFLLERLAAAGELAAVIGTAEAGDGHIRIL